MNGDQRDRYQPSAGSDASVFDDETESSPLSDGSLISSDGTFRKDVIRGTSTPILQRWERDGTVESVRKRMSAVLFVSIAVIVLQQTVTFDGFSETVVNAWAVAALPTAAVTGTLRKTLEEPERADEIWFSGKTLATAGVIVLAVLTRWGHKSPAGRVAWQLLFGERRPMGIGDQFQSTDSTVDESTVGELKQLLFFAGAGSIAVFAVEQIVVGNQGNPFDDTGENPLDGVGGLDVFGGLGPVEWTLISAGMVVAGTVLGALLAVSRP